MPLMTWNREMSVGVAQLDTDHKKLVDLVNDLHDGILSGQTRDALGHVLGELIRYTQVHFKHEEDLFARTADPCAVAHKKEHDDLIVKASELQTRYKDGGKSMLSLETMAFLKSWLSHHIQESDKAYGPHLNSKGVH